MTTPAIITKLGRSEYRRHSHYFAQERANAYQQAACFIESSVPATIWHSRENAPAAIKYRESKVTPPLYRKMPARIYFQSTIHRSLFLSGQHSPQLEESLRHQGFISRTFSRPHIYQATRPSAPAGAPQALSFSAQYDFGLAHAHTVCDEISHLSAPARSAASFRRRFQPASRYRRCATRRCDVSAYFARCTFRRSCAPLPPPRSITHDRRALATDADGPAARADCQRRPRPAFLRTRR